MVPSLHPFTALAHHERSSAKNPSRKAESQQAKSHRADPQRSRRKREKLNAIALPHLLERLLTR
ncbi:hypothetical protein AGABI1DRAFT_111129 [Agaricus bisporus var. burnettii JB137-S8]|uniref:Uncharacterized protein n=1 Tax=Agaricus bisporus var. burnettii (strain JB137-S8 / ATCC MYA-4627 / FGSC 10392) TaxID=597362 RepID=K5Y3K1_AGABU|nr:uncharacterized protein AGABI1DRAFT_111129 [Agaricus bisporus var. burnettii JB137-S8]EKM82525.1 hypothetical protein AGABI1DRAFT_111129 [Agaricus bisporus var. burnettii JB137-S8]